mmetsp:Transcript_9758/g.14980  ORF Transcript_9758/g.14980 Transcript_9758/m.14980 type:complete len:301 (+) Transcript_9758:225-1127(+)|eukprot:CAMPEP_0195283000 /NCGR_PEP_ID=MMETSP0707-20130614/1698_1 /TAXON_ID=33640 /ORGANISM="Asterionellopsis glacialis, Strain CCMP134" /LENGTH=300 /DNA_ID=CAMNT_0040342097 /DNA_START=185 /DNA_END=1087 /DNA_ORIENTATION=+
MPKQFFSTLFVILFLCTVSNIDAFAAPRTRISKASNVANMMVYDQAFQVSSTVPQIDEGRQNEKNDNAFENKSIANKVVDGLKVAPIIATLPLYGLGFGILGPKFMWKFSKWIYGLTNPSDDVLHAHFDRVAAYLYSGKELASKKLVSYRVHPLFAGLSLISTAVLAFVDKSSIIKVVSYNHLLFMNMMICFISALAAFPLHKIMIGNLNAKKWILVQGKVSMLFAALALSPGRLGRVMVHLNWAVLFAGGFMERLYILCVMSQLNIPDRKSYLKYYSPQIKATTLGSIPLGLATFFYFG